MRSTTKPHPLTQWLLDELSKTDGGEAIILTSSARAAAAQRQAVLAGGNALLGVSFSNAQALASACLQHFGIAAPGQSMDPLEEREILRDCLIGRQGAVARYAAAFPAALAELLAAVKELQHAGPFEMVLDDPWSIELNEITEDFRSRTRNRRTPARMIELATETLGRKKHWPVHILVAGVPHLE
ncbi:MAG: hypothetical protein QF412_09395, partial [Planctomycetota bacterium]|nr:hypothetical protein [Planctomycetota bacterium]